MGSCVFLFLNPEDGVGGCSAFCPSQTMYGLQNWEIAALLKFPTVFFPPEDPLSDPKLESQFPLILVPLLKSFAKLFTVERRVVERFSFHYFKIASL